MAETRYKLSKKQYDLYVAARQRAIQAEQDFNAARVNLATVSELIFDRWELDPKTPARIDDESKELVLTPPDEKAKEEKGKKGKKSGAAPAAEVPAVEKD